MILGRIIGKSSTLDFKFLISYNAKKFDYVQVMHKDYYVLAQIMEIEKEKDESTAYCDIIGYRQKERLLGLVEPLDPGNEVLLADDDFVREVLGLGDEGAFIGVLNGRDKLKVFLDVNKLMTKHVSILAKSGSGKSYFAGVLIEELLEKNLPVIIIDPHGEYSTLKIPNNEGEKLARFSLKSKAYKIIEYAPHLTEAKPLRLNSRNLSSSELIHILPAKLSNAQLGVLYSALRDAGRRLDFDEIILALQQEDSSVKWTLVNILEYVRNLGLFSDAATRMDEIVKPGTAVIINLKGLDAGVQEVVVYKLVKDLFEERKLGNITPFFLIIEEAHNYIPERGYGEAKSSTILRQAFSEGRKFGLGMCLITQRPSRVEKNALSQITTQIILKVTNANDIRALSSSVEGLTASSEKEIQNIPIGTAMITGIVDIPLYVDIRPRRSKHGGGAVVVQDRDIDEGELLPLIKPLVSIEDFKIMNDKKEVKIVLIPCLFLDCKQGKENFNLLVNLHSNEIITDVDVMKGVPLSIDLRLSKQQIRIFQLASRLKEFKPAELFASSGIQFSEIYDIVSSLAQKGVFVKERDSYRVNERYNLDLGKYAVYQKIDFNRIKYDEKLSKNFDVKEVVDFLNNLIEVKNERECWVVSYS